MFLSQCEDWPSTNRTDTHKQCFCHTFKFCDETNTFKKNSSFCFLTLMSDSIVKQLDEEEKKCIVWCLEIQQWLKLLARHHHHHEY